jgi:hypothetical protein
MKGRLEIWLNLRRGPRVDEPIPRKSLMKLILPRCELLKSCLRNSEGRFLQEAAECRSNLMGDWSRAPAQRSSLLAYLEHSHILPTPFCLPPRALAIFNDREIARKVGTVKVSEGQETLGS